MSGLHTRGSLAASDPSSRWWLWDHIADSLFYTATNIVYAAPFFFYLSLIGVLFELTWECVLTFFLSLLIGPLPCVSLSPSDPLQCWDVGIARGLAGDSSRLWRKRFHYWDKEWHAVVLAKLHKLERQKDFWRHRETRPTSQEARSLGLVEQMLHRWACTHAHSHTHLPCMHTLCLPLFSI